MSSVRTCLLLTQGEHMRQILFSMALLVGLAGVAFGQTAPASEIAPSGKLRVGMIAITVLGAASSRDRTACWPQRQTRHV